MHYAYALRAAVTRVEWGYTSKSTPRVSSHRWGWFRFRSTTVLEWGHLALFELLLSRNRSEDKLRREKLIEILEFWNRSLAVPAWRMSERPNTGASHDSRPATAITPVRLVTHMFAFLHTAESGKSHGFGKINFTFVSFRWTCRNNSSIHLLRKRNY